MQCRQLALTAASVAVQDYNRYFPPFPVTVLKFIKLPLHWFLPAEKFDPLPDIEKVWRTDASFAEQRLSGANPLMIRACKVGDARADVLNGVKLPADYRELRAAGALTSSCCRLSGLRVEGVFAMRVASPYSLASAVAWAATCHVSRA
jgi:hypothetical protein